MEDSNREKTVHIFCIIFWHQNFYAFCIPCFS